MPSIKRKRHEFGEDAGKEEDIIIKSFGFRFNFQKYYQLISLGNDLLTGVLYVIASVLTLLDAPSVYSNFFYFLGALFLTLRPLIKIYRNTFISKAQPAQTKSKTDIKMNLKDANNDLQQLEKDRIQAEKDHEAAKKAKRKFDE